MLKGERQPTKCERHMEKNFSFNFFFLFLFNPFFSFASENSGENSPRFFFSASGSVEENLFAFEAKGRKKLSLKTQKSRKRSNKT
jgi:hypothetical protein